MRPDTRVIRVSKRAQAYFMRVAGEQESVIWRVVDSAVDFLQKVGWPKVAESSGHSAGCFEAGWDYKCLDCNEVYIGPLGAKAHMEKTGHRRLKKVDVDFKYPFGG